MDKKLVPGAGAFQVALHHHLITNHARGKSRAGIQAFAEAMLVIPKTLAGNAGLQILETVSEVQDQYSDDSSKLVGVNLDTGKPLTLQRQESGITTGSFATRLHQLLVLRPTCYCATKFLEQAELRSRESLHKLINKYLANVYLS